MVRTLTSLAVLFAMALSLAACANLADSPSQVHAANQETLSDSPQADGE